MQKKNFVKPLFKVDHSNLHIAFFFECLVTTTIISIIFIIDDVFTKYMEKERFTQFQKYVVHAIAIFITIFLVLYTFLFIFGYGEVIIVPK